MTKKYFLNSNLSNWEGVTELSKDWTQQKSPYRSRKTKRSVVDASQFEVVWRLRRTGELAGSDVYTNC